MTLFSTLSLAAAMFILAITPGPGVFVTVASALSSNFKKTIPVVIGIVVGDLLFLLFAIYGLAFIAETLNNFFIAIKYIGGIYLIVLGIQLWRASKKSLSNYKLPQSNAKKGFFSGLSITLANPKVIFFYLGFLPVFVNLHDLDSTDVVLIAFIVSFVLGSVMLAYAYAANQSQKLLRNQSSQTTIQRVASAIMISAGVSLIAKN